MTIYIDDILIYSHSSYKDYENNVRVVLYILIDIKLNLNPLKCEFSIKTVKYLILLLL